MMFIALTIAILLIAVILPLSAKKSKASKFYKIDTDTSNATYAVNEFGSLERIKTTNSADQTEMEL